MGNAATPAITDMAAQGAQIDANFTVSDRIAWAFAPHEQSTPNMTVRLEAGGLFNGSTITERSAQNTGTITAPSSNPRIDRIVVDRASGDVSVVTGTESGSPTAPAVPEGKVPVAQVALAVAASAITNAMITDERVLNALGLGSIAFQNANNVSITGGTITNLAEPLAIADGGTGATTVEGIIDALDLGTMALQDADNVDISGGSIAGITDLAIADGGTGASNALDARANLGAVNIAGDTMTGNLAVSKNDSNATLVTISNTNSVASAIAGFNVFSDSAGLQLRVRNSIGGSYVQFFGYMPTGLYFDQEMESPGGYFFRLGTSYVEWLSIQQSGVGIKTTSPTSEFDVNGTVTATNLLLTNDLPVTEGGTGASTAADARTNLGIGTLGEQNASSVSITGGSITGITDLAIADGGTGASTAANARTNLGLGTIATQNANGVSISGGSITGITDLAVADGGTGTSSLTSNAVLLGNGTSAISTVSGLGTSGQVLTSNGTGAAPTFQSLPASGGGYTNVQTFTSSGTWTKPSGVDYVMVTVVAGGGGGSDNGSSAHGGGGAAVTAIVPVSGNVTVTVGAGGAAGTYPTQYGGTGGTSSFGSAVVANGGTGGLVNMGGEGGEYPGAPGLPSMTGSAIVIAAAAGAPNGNSGFYMGSTPATNTVSTGYGAGGGCDTSNTGKPGTAGIVIVRW